MPRNRRQIKSNTCYEICFRAKSTLPLVAYRVIALIIQSAIARTQRDDKVILCHHIWNGSHPHIIAVSKDAQQFVNFYSEIYPPRASFAVQNLSEWVYWLNLRRADLPRNVIPKHENGKSIRFFKKSLYSKTCCVWVYNNT